MIEKQALEYVVELGTTEVIEVGDRFYSNNNLQLIKEATPNPIQVNTLSGFIDYLQSQFDGSNQIMVHIESPTKVSAFSSFNRDFNRNLYIVANALLPEFRFDRFYDTETFNIKLQSGFVRTDDRDVMLKLVGNIREESVSSYGDDGISQSVVARTGVAMEGDVLVPNPVFLAPFRTFVEVEQPGSDFVFRMRKGPECSLFEADGGAWQQEAMKNVRDYLQESLSEEINQKRITIIA